MRGQQDPSLGKGYGSRNLVMSCSSRTLKGSCPPTSTEAPMHIHTIIINNKETNNGTEDSKF